MYCYWVIFQLFPVCIKLADEWTISSKPLFPVCCRNSTPTQDKTKELEVRCSRLEHDLYMEKRKCKDLERRLQLEKNRNGDLLRDISELKKENSSLRLVIYCWMS